MPKNATDQPAPLSGGLLRGVDADFLSALANIIQLVGIFIAVLANVTSAKRTSTALDEADERLVSLRHDLAEIELQVQRARRGRPSP